MVGGRITFTAIRGDGRTPVKWESAANQRKALDALANTLKPSELTIPNRCWTPFRRGRRGSGASRAVSAHHRRQLRPVEPRDSRRGRDHRLHAGTRSRRANGGAARGRSRAARAGRSDRPADEGYLRRARGDAYEQEVRRSEQRVLVDRVMWLARARRMRRSGRWRHSSCRSWPRGCAPRPGQRGRPGATHAAGGRHQAFPGASAETMRVMPAPDAPPGAPIGEPALDWLAPAPWK